MNKDNIVQFVGFTTQLEREEFGPKWEAYAKAFATTTGDTILQQDAGIKGKYKYVSKHEFRKQDFRFKFMKGRTSEHFPDTKVKVVQAGGYTPVKIGCTHHDESEDVKVIGFIGHDENDINYYYSLPCHYLNIYQAYYENCTYAYIFEFFVPEQDAPLFIEQLKKRTGIDVAAYKECLAMHA